MFGWFKKKEQKEETTITKESLNNRLKELEKEDERLAQIWWEKNKNIKFQKLLNRINQRNEEGDRYINFDYDFFYEGKTKNISFNKEIIKMLEEKGFQMDYSNYKARIRW